MIPLARIRYLVRQIHVLGERPLAELFIELDRGADLHSSLERYARLSAEFIRQWGDRLPSPRVVGRRP
jgi:hypothetical protein